MQAGVKPKPIYAERRGDEERGDGGCGPDLQLAQNEERDDKTKDRRRDRIDQIADQAAGVECVERCVGEYGGDVIVRQPGEFDRGPERKCDEQRHRSAAKAGVMRPAHHKVPTMVKANITAPAWVRMSARSNAKMAKAAARERGAPCANASAGQNKACEIHVSVGAPKTIGQIRAVEPQANEKMMRPRERSAIHVAARPEAAPRKTESRKGQRPPLDHA